MNPLRCAANSDRRTARAAKRRVASVAHPTQSGHTSSGGDMVAARAISRACAATPDKARPGLEPSLQWHHIGGGYPPVSSGAAAPLNGW